jgi:hypothetical protein
VSQLEVDYGKMCGLAVGVYRGVSVVPVSPVVVPCGGLMLQHEQHGRGGNALLRVLCLMEPRGEAGGGLSSCVICAFYIHVRGL